MALHFQIKFLYIWNRVRVKNLELITTTHQFTVRVHLKVCEKLTNQNVMNLNY